jgi:hypothetical protein
MRRRGPGQIQPALPIMLGVCSAVFPAKYGFLHVCYSAVRMALARGPAHVTLLASAHAECMACARHLRPYLVRTKVYQEEMHTGSCARAWLQHSLLHKIEHLFCCELQRLKTADLQHLTDLSSLLLKFPIDYQVAGC